MSADNSSLLPPPEGSSMAMQVNARTHSEPFMATNLQYFIPPWYILTPLGYYVILLDYNILTIIQLDDDDNEDIMII